MVGVDEGHLPELEIAWESWRRNRKALLKEKILFVCDSAGGSWKEWSRKLAFCSNKNITGVVWNGDHLREKGADQREVMLTGLVWGASRIDTDYYIKIDTDTIATPLTGNESRRRYGWLPGEWFDDDLAFTSHRWGYTRPSSFIRALDEWAEGVPELRENPCPVLNLPDNPEARVSHPRIQSWFLIGTTRFARVVWEMVLKNGGRMPCPSQDTLLWYVAERMDWPYKRSNLKKRGWDHGRRALRRFQDGME
tara:strand:- start:4652 stop:5404 length:753 start_codon:yes stop_codon:yes gene_type:complete